LIYARHIFRSGLQI